MALGLRGPQCKCQPQHQRLVYLRLNNHDTITLLEIRSLMGNIVLHNRDGTK